MRQSPLLDLFHARGATLADYRGSLTWNGHPSGNLAPPPPRLWDASWRAVLRASGADARKWLNGMISANVAALEPGGWAPSFQLDPKGHVLALLDIACTGEQEFLLFCDEEARADLLARLQRFVFISKVTLADESESWGALRLNGDGARAAWSAAQLEVAAPEPGHVSAPAADLAFALGSAQGLEFWGHPEAVRRAWERLQSHATPGDAGEQEHLRILAAEPRYGADITAADLPQETGELARLDFRKGCYVGQEIVERIRARGAVHRHLRALRFTAPVVAGATLSIAGAVVGKLTSVAPREGEWRALGYVRDPHGAPGTELQANDAGGAVLP
ncbi:MAG: YgfZ/GcvT domain-containing protein [Terriglobales bacterium]